MPATVPSLADDLRQLGVSLGDVVLVHTSLSRLGWIVGGAQAMVEALLCAVGPQGTVVMPAHSGLSDPAGWRNPPVPTEWLDTIRASMPLFDPALTPTRAVGQVVECFRGHPRAVRGNHPTVSFVAVGPDAAAIVEPHPLSPALGEGSPLARLYDLTAKVLLLGVDHANDTSLHLAEYRAVWDGKHDESHGAAVLVNRERRWVTYDDLAIDSSDFAAIGEDFAETGAEVKGTIGEGIGRLCGVREIVDFSVGWIAEHRSRADDTVAAPPEVTVRLVGDEPDLHRVFAEWHWKEWAEGSSSVEAWTERVARRCTADRVPFTVVAHAAGHAVGSLAVCFGDFDDRYPLVAGPWVTGVFVATKARNLGVGRAMLTFAEKRVRGLGYEELWLHTGEASRFYQRFGYDLIAAKTADLDQDAVLRKRLSTQTS